MKSRTSPRHLTPVAVKAFGRALRLLEQYDKDGRKWSTARDLKVPAPRLGEYLTGKRPIARDARFVDRVIVRLIYTARYTVSNENIRARLLKTARAIGGDAVFRKEYRDMETHEIEYRIRKPKQWASGIHVAPFLSLTGRPMLVALHAGQVGLVAELTACETRQSDTGEAVETGCASAETLTHYRHPLLPRGIHYAPWSPWGSPDGACILAIDAGHRLVAQTNVSDDDAGAIVDARKDMAAALEIAEGMTAAAVADAEANKPYSDSYDDGWEREDMTGESWKDGTIYDKRTRE